MINYRNIKGNICMELFSLRKEIKYVLSLERALLIRRQLDKLLLKDSHCLDGAYSVRSLYFDTIYNKDFSDKVSGIERRKKIRLRIYNDDISLCKLEIKQKEDDLQQKLSCTISMADAQMLMHSNYSILKKYFDSGKTAVKAYSIMMQEHYKPVVQIKYDRIAYKYPMYDTRITLDMDIRACESNMDIFSQNIGFIPIMPEMVVLEVKYNGKFMGFISDLLSQYNLTQNSYSKYCSGRLIYCDFNY